MILRIRSLREDNDYTQQYIASYLSCDQSQYSKYERQERDIPLIMVYKLALLYNVSIDYIVGLTDDPIPPKRNKKGE